MRTFSLIFDNVVSDDRVHIKEQRSALRDSSPDPAEPGNPDPPDQQNEGGNYEGDFLFYALL